MDLQKLPPLIIQRQIFGLLDPASLLNAIQCCRFWRDFISENRFIDFYCQQHFGLPFKDLPDLLPWQELFITTQRLMFQKAPIIDFMDDHHVDRSIMRIYMMQLRLFWSYQLTTTSTRPCNEPHVHVAVPIFFSRLANGKETFSNFEIEMSGFPLDRFFHRIHAAFPILFDYAFVRFRGEDLFTGLTWRYWSKDAVGVYRRIYRRLIGDYRVGEGVKIVFEIATLETNYEGEGPTLSFYIYEDNSWKPCYYRQSGWRTPPLLPRFPSIDSDASLNEIRQFGEADVDLFLHYIQRDLSNKIKNSRSMSYVQCKLCIMHDWIYKSTMDECHKFYLFQQESIRQLESTITSICQIRAKTLIFKGANKRKVINFLDQLYPCFSLEHGTSCHSKHESSPIIRVALIRALRRLINCIYLSDVQRIFLNDDDTLRLMHLFARQSMWNEKSRSVKSICKTWKSKINSKEKIEAGKSCGMRILMKNACCHCAYPELWPATITNKVISDLPRLALELESDLMDFVSSGFKDSEGNGKYFYSLGYSLGILEKWAHN